MEVEVLLESSRYCSDGHQIDNESTAFAYHTIEAPLADVKSQAMQLEWNNKESNVGAFATFNYNVGYLIY